MKKYLYIFLSSFFIITCYNSNPHINNKKISSYYDFIEGNVPIILSIPHDGGRLFKNATIRNDSILNFNIKNDLNTSIIAKELYSKIHNEYSFKPYLLINNVHRKYVDLNRSFEEAYESEFGETIYNSYHNKLILEIKKMLTIYGKVYLFDIHGFSKSNLDVVISTRKHTTLSLESLNKLIYNDKSYFDLLKNSGFEVKINDPFYGGYLIKSVNDYFNSNFVSSVQIEIGKDIRFNENRKNTFIDITSKYFKDLIW